MPPIDSDRKMYEQIEMHIPPTESVHIATKEYVDAFINTLVPTTRTINGKQLNANIVLSKADIGLDKVANVDTTNAANIATGTLDNLRLSTSVTLAGNTFNGASQLIKLDSTGKIPVLNASLITALNGSAIATGTVADVRLTANVTLAGNTFNGINQLVKLDATGKLPVLDASLITAINGSAIASGTVADARLSTNVTVAGNTFNGINQLVKLDATGKLPALNASLVTALNGSAVATGTVADARLTTNVTLLGNTFNGVNQLVKLDATGKLPAIDGSALTNVTATTYTGNVADSKLSTNVTLAGNTFNGINQLVKLDANGKLPTLDASAISGVVHTNGDDLAIAGNKTFSGNVKFTSYFNIGQVGPIADSTTAYRVTKADNATNILVVDTINGKMSLGVNATAPVSFFDTLANNALNTQYGQPSTLLRNTNPTLGDGTSTYNAASQYVEAGNGTVSMAMRARYETGHIEGNLGTVSAHNVTLMTAGAGRMHLDTAGNVMVGNAALPVTATNGFLYIPTCAGAPTGTPTAYTGLAPIIIDTTNFRIYTRIGATWRRANLT